MRAGPAGASETAFWPFLWRNCLAGRTGRDWAWIADPLLALAVERLYELDTTRTRTLLLEEMTRPDPRLPYRTLAMLPDYRDSSKIL